MKRYSSPKQKFNTQFSGHFSRGVRDDGVQIEYTHGYRSRRATGPAVGHFLGPGYTTRTLSSDTLLPPSGSVSANACVLCGCGQQSASA
eukprot:2805740-Prymnesium_polylepis.1